MKLFSFVSTWVTFCDSCVFHLFLFVCFRYCRFVLRQPSLSQYVRPSIFLSTYHSFNSFSSTYHIRRSVVRSRVRPMVREIVSAGLSVRTEQPSHELPLVRRVCGHRYSLFGEKGSSFELLLLILPSQFFLLLNYTLNRFTTYSFTSILSRTFRVFMHRFHLPSFASTTHPHVQGGSCKPCLRTDGTFPPPWRFWWLRLGPGSCSCSGS